MLVWNSVNEQKQVKGKQKQNFKKLFSHSSKFSRCFCLASSNLSLRSYSLFSIRQKRNTVRQELVSRNEDLIPFWRTTASNMTKYLWSPALLKAKLTWWTVTNFLSDPLPWSLMKCWFLSGTPLHSVFCSPEIRIQNNSNWRETNHWMIGKVRHYQKLKAEKTVEVFLHSANSCWE